ncbi:tRNA lysidine(34) synthetase TilS [Cyclobacterium marinum]|uniref:tRNA(Ile)-lysidine synthase n=1 Tax=Cyclobacterium marinum (strain ATCC 25205 / DSM 745 / LMG 13164 / NCIMB 1802) TaxID=880070 RepID=G0J6T6_CYCMS|nr:tRNA lysidine(34) synthetase TilS [Cyclobacterium marinum]AEL26134.1 tRNA(Ile)-lysidine synthase [Cyclobacterium marinum DSM 745]MBI0399491.1 tRNA lysidine(34) synthetase TilS [Cyclobacterium marinum]
MLERFINHVRKNKILDVQLPYLVAVSGGVDSVVLAHLLTLAGFKISIVHCNFQLRGAASDADELFVIELGIQLGVPVHTKTFDTHAYMDKHGVSLQMGARDLRYNWFEELNSCMGTDGVIVAHHADDQIETVMLNLLRGTGIEGVYGMSSKRDFIRRPLLPFSRKEIKTFLERNNLHWTEDQSNAKTIYKRNFIRHKFLPLLLEFDPKGPELIQYSFDRLKDTGKAFFYLFDRWVDENVVLNDGFEVLSFSSIAGLPGKSSLLFYWLRRKGFVYAQIEDILYAVERQESGRQFLSEGWLLNIDREGLILGKQYEERKLIKIDLTDEGFVLDNKYSYNCTRLDHSVALDRSAQNALLDFDLLNFPLIIRNWEKGDKFMPLGMRNFKKVSDFLIDRKVPLIKKNEVKVMCSGDSIVWLVGFRIDDRFKISNRTKKVFYVKKLNHDKSF